MARKIINVILVITLILISWFGLGPAIYADGTGQERYYTLLTVSFLYLLIFLIMYYVNKQMKK